MKNTDRFALAIFVLFLGYFGLEIILRLGINGYINSQSEFPKETYITLIDLSQFVYLICIVLLIRRKYKWIISFAGIFTILFGFLSFIQTLVKIMNLKNYTVEIGPQEIYNIAQSIEELYYILIPYQILLVCFGMFLVFIENSNKEFYLEEASTTTSE